MTIQVTVVDATDSRPPLGPGSYSGRPFIDPNSVSFTLPADSPGNVALSKLFVLDGTYAGYTAYYKGIVTSGSATLHIYTSLGSGGNPSRSDEVLRVDWATGNTPSPWLIIEFDGPDRPSVEEFISQSIFGYSDILASADTINGVATEGDVIPDNGADVDLIGTAGDDRLEGVEGDDHIDGRYGNDTLLGAGGDDNLEGGAGDDFLNGGLGEDAAIFLGNASSFTIRFSKTGDVTVSDRVGAEGVDTLTGIEQIVFSDRTFDLGQFASLAALSEAEFITLTEIYVAYFNRAADAEGLYFWADKLAEGMDVSTIAGYFSQSAEAKALYPDPADTFAFVNSVYTNVLGRVPDAAGLEFWTTALNGGSIPPESFVLNIIGGAQGADISYLSSKTDLGVYFSAIKGMSDVSDAQEVMSVFGNQATSNLAGAKLEIDSHYADAISSSDGDFLFSLVGVVSDPFESWI
ncbi:Hemolysin, plasmid [Sulfitobacter indolifex]|uniref:DUF4214 domain-containing protein n=1 Tax=Sulfitobacter indolifex TaxID=225422 RepID=UPI0003109D39|nr:DUF4214 domain-containing protein [Sulfitobacter indolifex]UOA19333.1 Hemolysin, plasmid [Sulfitobacter indolifex]